MHGLLAKTLKILCFNKQLLVYFCTYIMHVPQVSHDTHS